MNPAPLPEPGPTPQLCPRCRAPLPDPKLAYCPNCGAPLQQRPVWLTVIAALGSALLGLVGLCLGGFGACVAVLAISSPGGLGRPDTLWIWGILAAAVLCTIAAVAIIVWLVKKPKP